MNDSEKKYFEKFGYNYFGPLLLCYSNWLIKNLEENNIDKVYFLARDGYIMKQVFDIVNNSKIKSYYFYASRRAVIVPYLWMIKNKEEIFKVIAFNKKITVQSFIKKVGLEDYDLTHILERYNYNLLTEINTEELESFNDFFEEIFPLIKENSKKEWKSLNNYAKKNSFEGKIAIVDIGWNGTMQNAFQKLYKDYDFVGYYFGIVPFNHFNNLNLNGYIFDKNKNIEFYHKMHYFINIFEFLFLAQHGSVKRYLENGKDVEFYKYEYENSIEKNIVQYIQKFAIKYVNDNKNAKLNDDRVIKRFINYFLRPSYKTAKLFGNLKFKDDEFKYIAKPDKKINYIKKPKKLLKDFLDSSWRIGFLKRVLMLPFPYYSFNNIVRKIYLSKEK